MSAAVTHTAKLSDLRLERRTLRRRLTKSKELGLSVRDIMSRIGELNLLITLGIAARKPTSHVLTAAAPFRPATARDPITGKSVPVRCQYIDDSGEVVFGYAPDTAAIL